MNKEKFFKSFSVELSDKLTKINNLFIKPGINSIDKKGGKNIVFKGDHTNTISALKTTKLENDTFENYGEDFLENTVFDMSGEKRSGYYYIQGGSELMITHAIQKALLDFNNAIEKIVN